MSGKFIDGQFHESNLNTQNDEHAPRVIVMRHAHGITLNPITETILDEAGNEMVFSDEAAARLFLLNTGLNDEDMEHLFFVELDNMPDGEEEPKVQGTAEDTGFKGFGFCDAYCSACEKATYNMPIGRASLCVHCGAKLLNQNDVQSGGKDI